METIPNIHLPSGWEGDPQYAMNHANMADSYINKEKFVCVNLYTYPTRVSEAEVEVRYPGGWIPIGMVNVTTEDELLEVIKVADRQVQKESQT